MSTKAIQLRERIRQRDGGGCAYCRRGDVAVFVDHVLPRSRGGSDNIRNLVLACVRCNSSKGSKTLTEWLKCASCPIPRWRSFAHIAAREGLG